MRTRLFRPAAASLVLLALLGACAEDSAPESTAGGPSGDDSVEVDRSDALMAALAEDEPGCSAAVSLDGEGAWTGSAGLADLDVGTPITATTVFDIGSTSKQFTATAVLALADEGELDLDESLASVVDDLPAWADEVSVRDLVLHQSGVPDYVERIDAEYSEPTTVEDALDALRGADELDFEPGSRFEYSNSGYFLLSQVVEARAGVTLADWLAENVFSPLGMDALMDPVADIEGKATSYESGDDGYEIADSLWEQTGDGGIQTTPTELTKWAAEYWDQSVGGDEVAAARTEEGAVDDGEGSWYGAGITFSDDDDGRLVYSHSGSWAGFVTEMMIVPEERLAVAVSCNQSDLDPTDMATDLVAIWSEG